MKRISTLGLALLLGCGQSSAPNDVDVDVAMVDADVGGSNEPDIDIATDADIAADAPNPPPGDLASMFDYGMEPLATGAIPGLMTCP